MEAALPTILGLLGIAIVLRLVAGRTRSGKADTTENLGGRVRTSRRGRNADLETIPTFSVVALGVAGSGKTVLASSMFHELNVATGGRSYFLETDMEQRVYLSNVFAKVSDPDEPWPRGTRTGETREFLFDCSTFREGVKYRLFRISYLDYAGELLETDQEPGSGAVSDLEERIGKAHALLVMIDGQRVVQYLRGEPQGRSYFAKSLQPILGVIGAAACPIHIALTKWDLLRESAGGSHMNDNDRLEMIRDALLSNSQIRATVERHASGDRSVRLIPVSAVGPDFAGINESGHVVKRRGAEVRPINVEVPFCAVLPDLFRQVEASLDASTRADITSRVKSEMRVTTGDALATVARFLSLPAGMVVGSALHVGLGQRHGDALMGMFLDWMSRPVDERTKAVQDLQNKTEQQATLIRRARQEVMQEFETTMLRLEAVLPASIPINR